MNYIALTEKNKEIIIKAFDYIWANPETGYKEVKTSKYLEDEFEKLGYELVKAGDIPGFYTVIDTGRPGPEVLVLGELDSLICFEHPECDPVTGAAHICGHHVQAASLLGIAAILKEPGVLDNLSGRIRLCAVPAEELIEVEYRLGLKREGRIHYMGGKPEFLYRGYFDGVDIAFMVHAATGDKITITSGGVGCVSKVINYKGKSAHAGGSPWNGCNALYAATLGLSAVNSLRETFKEADLIRVHPIITKGGGAVNAIPDNVVVESYVRGKTFDAIKTSNYKVNRAFIGAALSMGANVDIEDIPGYAPLNNDEGMRQVAYEAANNLGDVEVEINNNFSTGSTDMGDLSCIMPVVHPYIPGAVGVSHGSDYRVPDPEFTCLNSVKWQLGMLELLLKDDAKRAKKIIADYKPIFNSKEEYFEYVNEFLCDGDRITYNNEESATVKL